MQSNENNFNLIDARRAIIEKAISENTIYRTMMDSVLKNGINIDIKNLVDKYIEIYGANNFDINSVDSYETINNFILTNIDAITKEDNNLSLNDDGSEKQVDLPDSQIDKKMDIIFSTLPDYASEKQQDNSLEVHNKSKKGLDGSVIYNSNLNSGKRFFDNENLFDESFGEFSENNTNEIKEEKPKGVMQKIKLFFNKASERIKKSQLLGKLIPQSKQLALQEPEIIENNNSINNYNLSEISKGNDNYWKVSPDIIENTRQVGLNAKIKLENESSGVIENKKDIGFDEK